MVLNDYRLAVGGVFPVGEEITECGDLVDQMLVPLVALVLRDFARGVMGEVVV